jgi:hypothetical protein
MRADAEKQIVYVFLSNRTPVATEINYQNIREEFKNHL